MVLSCWLWLLGLFCLLFGGGDMRSCDACWSDSGVFVSAVVTIPVGSSGFFRFLCSYHHTVLEVE